MVALITGDPYRVSIKDTYLWGSSVGLLMGLSVPSDSAYLHGVIMLEDGNLQEIPITQFKVNWHYDVARDAFVDDDSPPAGDELSTDSAE